VVYDQTYHLLKNSDAALVASGTASLETALIGTPQVVCYGMNPLTFKLAMAMLKVRYVSLANLILDKLIFKELLQNDCNPEAMAGELLRLAEDSDCRSRMLADYAQVRAALGGRGAAGRIAAQIYSRLNLTPRLSVK
jgi:lipid-A-disaccharide synthase